MLPGQAFEDLGSMVAQSQLESSLSRRGACRGTSPHPWSSRGLKNQPCSYCFRVGDSSPCAARRDGPKGRTPPSPPRRMRSFARTPYRLLSASFSQSAINKPFTRSSKYRTLKMFTGFIDKPLACCSRLYQASSMLVACARRAGYCCAATSPRRRGPGHPAAHPGRAPA